jgi:hypothetical protein
MYEQKYYISGCSQLKPKSTETKIGEHGESHDMRGGGFGFYGGPRIKRNFGMPTIFEIETVKRI